MTRSKHICRFCLDTHNNKRNPLIRPCDCRGSVAYVHVLCLQQWQMMDFERNGTVCGLCLTDYTDTGNPYLERIPSDVGYTQFFLRYPFLAGIGVHYVWLTHLSFNETTIFNPHFNSLYIQYQIAFQILYFLTFGFHFEVRHLRHYQKEWLRLPTFFLFAFHFFGLFGLFYESLLAGVFLNLLLGFYWHNHCLILRNMNELFLAE